jgi:hypothetical protein
MILLALNAAQMANRPRVPPEKQKLPSGWPGAYQVKKVNKESNLLNRRGLDARFAKLILPSCRSRLRINQNSECSIEIRISNAAHRTAATSFQICNIQVTHVSHRTSKLCEMQPDNRIDEATINHRWNVEKQIWRRWLKKRLLCGSRVN